MDLVTHSDFVIEKKSVFDKLLKFEAADVRISFVKLQCNYKETDNTL